MLLVFGWFCGELGFCVFVVLVSGFGCILLRVFSGVGVLIIC